MSLYFYQHLPECISPIAFTIGRVEVSWYGIMYLIAFAIVYFLVRYRIKRKETSITLETVQDFFPWAIVGLLLGARLGDVIIYNWPYFSAHPLEIFLPFDVHNHWQYIGIYGMSYFGGLLGLAIAFVIFSFLRFNLKNPPPLPEGRCPSKFSKKILVDGEVGAIGRLWSNTLNFTDLFAPAIPLGCAFGRLGNFINGELYGRITTAPWGMYFPLDITGRLRHPSQLYEMFLEGILLFVILWYLRKYKSPTGYLTSFYLIGYGLARFTAEFFRQPDNDWFFLSLTLGQWFSVGIISLGIVIISSQKNPQVIDRNL